MKRYTLLYMMLLGTLLTGCAKEYLNRQPLSNPSPDTYFTSDAEMQLYVNSFYADLPVADEIYGEDEDNIIKTGLSTNQRGSRTVPVSGGGWSWGALRNINYFLTNYKNHVKGPAYNKFEAAARFFRAYFYADKVVSFGDVPFYNQPVQLGDSLNLNKARDSRQLVMDSVMADLDYAIAYLPAEKNVERVNKWTALAFKSRICLFEGTFQKYHNHMPDGQNKYLAAAADAAKKVIESGVYKISAGGATAYADLFNSTTSNTDEIILTRRYNNGLQLFHNANYYTLTSSYGKPGMEKKLVNSYLMKNGTRFTDRAGYDKMQFYDEMQNRDPRLAQTIRTPGYTRKGQSIVLAPDLGATVTGYQMTKFVAGTDQDVYNRSYTDMPIIRYAEVLLNYAEAKAELGTLTQADLDMSIKPLRDRVGMPNMNMAAANATPDAYQVMIYSNRDGSPMVTGGNSGVILEIRRERRVELVMEGLRRNDILRWRAGDIYLPVFEGEYFPGAGDYDLDKDGKVDLKLYTGTKPSGKGIQILKLGADLVLKNNTEGNVVVNAKTTKAFNQKRDYLLPIATQELQLNRNLKQNPGW